MMLTPELIAWLASSEEAKPWLEQLTKAPPDDRALLSILTQLRQHLGIDQAQALVTLARLRHRARKKFPDHAHRLFFTSTALQQASPIVVARWTAQRYRHVPWVADLGCGMGGDAMAIAGQGSRVLAIDRDPVALALINANARALNLPHIYPTQADIARVAWQIPVAWADPGRRTTSQRVFHPEALQPPLSALLKLQRTTTPHLGIKLMPGIHHRFIPSGVEVEWISLDHELKECVFWFGDLAERAGRRATVLPAGVSLWHEGSVAPRKNPGQFLYEPDPAVIRAGAVGDLANQLQLWQIDEEIAYLSGDRRIDTPFARVWRILEHHPFNLKRLNQRLRGMQAEVVAVKKRGSPIDPEAFRKKLHRTHKGHPVVVVLTRVHNRPWMLLCERCH